MENQTQAVTLITSAVDETALSAQSLSTLIASIQDSTGAITHEIESQGTEFRGVDQQLASLNDAVQAFLGRVAA